MEKYKLTIVYDGGIDKEHYFEAEQEDVDKISQVFQLAFEQGMNARITIPTNNSTSVINVSKVLECKLERLETKAE